MPDSLPKPVGRPTVMTDEVVAKLETVFAMDGTVGEACSYAGISKDSYYDYLKIKPGFSDRVAELRERPMLKARQSIINGLKDPEFALKYAERKRRGEFAVRQEFTGENGTPLTVSLSHEIATKNNVPTLNTINSSEGHTSLPSGELRTPLGQDDLSSGGNEGQSAITTEQDSVHSTNLPTGT